MLMDINVGKDRLDNTQAKVQVEYEPLSVSEYEKRYHDRQIKYLEKKAAKFGFQLASVAP